MFILHFMKVSTENNNNFGYEKITIVVDNIPLISMKTILHKSQTNFITRTIFLRVKWDEIRWNLMTCEGTYTATKTLVEKFLWQFFFLICSRITNNDKICIGSHQYHIKIVFAKKKIWIIKLINKFLSFNEY